MRHASLVAALALFGGCYNPSIKNGGFTCSPGDNPPVCPDGFHCDSTGSCVSGSGAALALSIPKGGAVYQGNHLDPMLDDPAGCPDKSLEPNDTPSTAVTGVMAPPDVLNPKLINLAICPKGNNPFTQQHDVDFYQVDLTSAPSSALTLKAELFYDIQYGDLDLGIFDASGHPIATDGSAVSNGCVVTAVGAAKYYVVVVGANNTDSNRYELRVRTFTMANNPAASCSPPDGGT
jgi:hypothetical protein